MAVKRAKYNKAYRLVCTARELDEYHMLASACDMSLGQLIRTLLHRQINYLKTGEIPRADAESEQVADLSDVAF